MIDDNKVLNHIISLFLIQVNKDTHESHNTYDRYGPKRPLRGIVKGNTSEVFA